MNNSIAIEKFESIDNKYPIALYKCILKINTKFKKITQYEYFQGFLRQDLGNPWVTQTFTSTGVTTSPDVMPFPTLPQCFVVTIGLGISFGISSSPPASPSPTSAAIIMLLNRFNQ